MIRVHKYWTCGCSASMESVIKGFYFSMSMGFAISQLVMRRSILSECLYYLSYSPKDALKPGFTFDS